MADIYPDDTTISFLTHYMAAPNDISDCLQTDVDENLNWSADNKMIVIETKTKSMHFTLELHVNSTELAQVRSHKLLGS